MLTPDEFNRKFGYYLEEIFQKREINRSWLSEDTNIPLASIYAYGQRRQMPSAYRAYKIMTRLGMTVDDIVKGEINKCEPRLVNVSLPSKEEFNVSLKKNLNQLLKDHNLTKKELADRTGLAKGTITNIFTGKRIPKLSMIYIIASTLEIKIDSLLKPVNSEVGV